MLWPFLVGVALLIALAYWQLILAEGVYLGRRVVVWPYDLGARSYDRIKDFDDDDDTDYLARPLIERLASGGKGVREWGGRGVGAFPHSPAPPLPHILDVASGTGRLPLALLLQPDFTGSIVALDASAGMLAQARAKLAPWLGRVTLVQHDAVPLPYPAAHFEAVTCLEALEFLPDPDAALAEMTRVLRPGGTLLVSLRIGLDRLLFPGRIPSQAAFVKRLTALGLTDIQVLPWQTYYSLVWAVRET